LLSCSGFIMCSLFASCIFIWTNKDDDDDDDEVYFLIHSGTLCIYWKCQEIYIFLKFGSDFYTNLLNGNFFHDCICGLQRRPSYRLLGLQASTHLLLRVSDQLLQLLLQVLHRTLCLLQLSRPVMCWLHPVSSKSRLEESELRRL